MDEFRRMDCGEVAMADKVTQAEMERRVNVVYEMLLNGASRHAILQYCSSTWKITPRHGDNLIAKANKAFEEQAAFVRERELGKSINRLTALYMRTMADKDYRGALAVQKELNSMLGLNAPTRSEHEIKDWRSQAIEDIKAGTLTYNALAMAFDNSLAAELFREAGVLVNEDAS